MTDICAFGHTNGHNRPPGLNLAAEGMGGYTRKRGRCRCKRGPRPQSNTYFSRKPQCPLTPPSSPISLSPLSADIDRTVEEALTIIEKETFNA